MPLGAQGRRKTPIGVIPMLFALVIAAFLGAAVGLVWQSSDFLDEEPEEEVVTTDQAPD